MPLPILKIYLYDEEGILSGEFTGTREVCCFFGISMGELYQALNYENRVQGYRLSREKKEKIQIYPDIRTTPTFFRSADSDPLDPKSWTECSNQKAAARKTGVCPFSIRCHIKAGGHSPVKGYFFKEGKREYIYKHYKIGLKINSKQPLNAIHIDTGVILPFNSLYHAAACLNIDLSGIRKCLSGQTHTAKGYRFEQSNIISI